MCGQTLTKDSSTGIISLLTKCCKAASKYMDIGVVGESERLTCKKCYQEVPVEYGSVALYLAELADILEMLGCPCADDCADNTVWHFLLLEEQREEAETA